MALAKNFGELYKRERCLINVSCVSTRKNRILPRTMVVLATKIGGLASKYLGDEEITNYIVMDI